MSINPTPPQNEDDPCLPGTLEEAHRVIEILQRQVTEERVRARPFIGRKELIAKARKRVQEQADYAADADAAYESLRAGVLAVIDHCKTMPVETIRILLVGLLPETQDLEPDVRARMIAAGGEALVEHIDELTREAWQSFGYDGPVSDGE